MRYTIVFILSVVLFIACSLSPEQQASLQTYFQQELDAGRITKEQFDALMAAMTAGNWQGIQDVLIATGLGIVGSLTGVRVWRGGVTSRRGVVPQG